MDEVFHAFFSRGLGFEEPGNAERSSVLRGYWAAFLVSALCTFVSIALSVLSATSTVGMLQTWTFATTFPLGMLFVTMRFGVGPAVFMAAVGVLVFDFIFVPPPLEFTVPSLRDGVELGVMLAVAATASVLAERLRQQVAWARRQADVERLRNALLCGLSHDLRTPLAALVGAGTALCEDTLDPSERREFSRMVAEEAFRLNRLVSHLLELTRLESGGLHTKPGPQAIDETIGAALCHLERQLVGRTVRTHAPEEIPLTAFDPVLIEQVIVNLVENVIRHTPEGSPIEISVCAEEGHVKVDVADRGPGVPAGEEERVFERHYRGPAHRQKDGGLGLGLALCRAILAAHGGRIWLKNRPSGGAVVRFVIPIQNRATTPHAPHVLEVGTPHA
jgi:K+-sensing histidine kinase KdpD